MGRIGRLTASQLRIAAKKPRKGTPDCHEESMKVFNGLEATNFDAAPLWKYVADADKCLEEARELRKRTKPNSLYLLTAYLSKK
mmetsp:Transcript_503/g.476  ORF Transcript_503/g.476 Transcript_503/m.476 type:complete len:84 (-) Transcript_503:89-340(-)|eukprot:CAMPEP_0197738766 /NCGR_PEP_ID=MMETSP1435-20131217/16376_1 /TAXON_ID=426625 /ORGANISM="Chaetoceros brevis, Strain CCMP164" /LENGTH=83 /DNA_ID=CAMNT_0043327803 /DNA_START=36 /DNA_END=287 /DNA_ORIENTATION=-